MLENRKHIESTMTDAGYSLDGTKVLSKRGINTIVFVPNQPGATYTFYQAQALGTRLCDTSDRIGTVEQMKEWEELYIDV